MALVPPNENINKLIKAFGLDINQMVSFKLVIEPDAIVTIETTMYPSKEDIENGAKAGELLMKEYQLVEKKEMKEDSFFDVVKGMAKL